MAHYTSNDRGWIYRDDIPYLVIMPDFENNAEGLARVFNVMENVNTLDDEEDE